MNSRQTEEGEVWRPCPDFEHWYEVSNYGRVRSSARGVKILAHGNDSHGYLIVGMSKDGKRYAKTVHRLVCRAFHGEPSLPGLEAAHLNGDRTDPRAENLAWVTKAENHRHMQIHGTKPHGENHPRAKLNEKAVKEIYLSDEPASVFAEKFGATVSAVDDIRAGKNWARVTASLTPPERTPGGKQKTKVDEALFLEAMEEGLGGRRLARRFNISISTASKWQKRMKARPSPTPNQEQSQ